MIVNINNLKPNKAMLSIKAFFKIGLLMMGLLIAKNGYSQTAVPVLTGPWKAWWINVPDESATGYGYVNCY